MKRTLRAMAVDLISVDQCNEQNWRDWIVQGLNQPSSNVAAKDFIILNRELYIEAVIECWLEPYP